MPEMLDQKSTYDESPAKADNQNGCHIDVSRCAPSPSAPSLTPCEAAPESGTPSKAPRKAGAKPGNEHALRTGLRSPKCPTAARGIDGMRYAFRRRAFADWKARNAT